MLDYATLRLIWWVLLGVLLIGFAIMDGFDLGVAALLPFLGKNDEERRIMINTVGPVWEGNQVWFILGGGAIFAAWPSLYAMSFSGFYLAMFITLCAFILRPVSFKFRSKIENSTWRNTWDILLCLSGVVPSLIFGVAVGNVIQGVPFHFDQELRGFYTGTFWELLNPFALCCGLLSLLMLMSHGAYYLVIKTENALEQRARFFARLSGLLCVILFLGIGFYAGHYLSGYQLSSPLLMNGYSNPLHKAVALVPAAWLSHYQATHHLFFVPWIAAASLFLGVIVTFFRLDKLAFIYSGVGIAGIIASVGLTMYPFILPSSSDPRSSLMVFDASSSQMTLFIMLVATVIFLPIILFYTSWVYRVLRGKVTSASVSENKQSY